MPNWVINRLRIEGENAEEIIKKHIIKDERGEYAFDFNTIVKMPEDLCVEKGSRTYDGLKLYIAKINPLIPNFGTMEDKLLPLNDFFKKMVTVFGYDCIDKIEKYILKPSQIDNMKEKYKETFDEVLKLGEKVFNNKEKYGFTDWYDWSCYNWGTKWNACNTILSDDLSEVYFDTAWSPSIPAISKLSKLHPELTITHEYAEEQTGFFSGRIIYENGEIVSNESFEEYSKEAYEMSFDLWGNDEQYVFDKEKNNYVYIDEENDSGMEAE